MDSPLKKDAAPNFMKPEIQQAFVHDAKDGAALLHKEIDINLAEQNLLLQRIRVMKEFVNDLPASDPQYSMILIQLQMDQIELDELKRREESISHQLKKI